MAKLKKASDTFYIGKPVKKGKMYEQKVAWVEINPKGHSKVHYQKSYSSKASDFKTGFMGFGVTQRAKVVTENQWKKILERLL